MILHGQIMQGLLLVVMIGISWFAPRSLGLLGLIAGHFVCVLGWCGMGGIALASGIWEEYELVELIGFVGYAVVFNTLMLPVGIVAMRRWERLSPLSRRYSPPAP